MKMKSKILAIAIFGLCTLGATAQEESHFLQFNIGGGMQTFMYDANEGSKDNKLGYDFNLNYSYFFADNWGLGLGVGVHNQRAESTFDYSTQEDKIDSDNDKYILTTQYNSTKELQKALFIDIPVGAYCQFDLFGDCSLLGNLGVKFMIPANGKYEIESGDITTTGYYPQYNATLENDLPQHEFETNEEKYSGTWDPKFTIGLFAKCGILYNLADDWDLYAGAYFDMGINKTQKECTTLPLYSERQYNGATNSDRIDGMRNLSVGLELGVRWRISFLEGKPLF